MRRQCYHDHMTVALIPLVYADPTGVAHDTGPGHPEQGGRLKMR